MEHDRVYGYDAVVSIEMFAAVGKSLWPVYFHALKQLLKPRSRALIQSITISVSQFETYRTSSDFVREFIFPGGMLPSLERFVDTARRAGLAPEPVRAFGPDYARTCLAGPIRSTRRLGACAAVDETFIRTWRLYLANCEAGFAERRTDVMHFIVSSGS
ncbi:class I SAM-dependent methyltransferase [Burkholderia multivorans]|uniref:class I SAM-dependent methyltransferase n=1 Tax=Burkholderia multivorans TaxID=87883 RepID=UPI002235DD5C|nr:class I SAM-dependent methyltransferase [Burkholderia multivorans]